MSNCCKDQEKYQQLQAVIDAKKGMKGALMPVMQEAQAIFGYLPKEVQQFIADGLGVTLSEVYGVSTFYAQFVLEPQGEHVIGVCLGALLYAIFIMGSPSTAVKVGVIAALVLTTNPVGAHAIAKGAYQAGIRPEKRMETDDYRRDFDE